MQGAQQPHILLKAIDKKVPYPFENTASIELRLRIFRNGNSLSLILYT